MPLNPAQKALREKFRSTLDEEVTGRASADSLSYYNAGWYRSTRPVRTTVSHEVRPYEDPARTAR